MKVVPVTVIPRHMTTSLRDNPSPQSTLGLTADERFNYSKQQGFNGDALLAVVPAVVQGIKVGQAGMCQSPASVCV